jgi:hypothetical protein
MPSYLTSDATEEVTTTLTQGALARKLAGVMLSMWKNEQDFRGPTAEEALLLE